MVSMDLTSFLQPTVIQVIPVILLDFAESWYHGEVYIAVPSIHRATPSEALLAAIRLPKRHFGDDATRMSSTPPTRDVGTLRNSRFLQIALA